MNENMSPPSSWYSPPDLHEVCKCESCHESGEHEGDEFEWSKLQCPQCIDYIDKDWDEES